MNYYGAYDSDALAHHGIKGQKWGVRRYQNEDGTRTAAGKARYRTDSRYDIAAEKQTKKTGKIARQILEADERGEFGRRNRLERKGLRAMSKTLNANDRAAGYHVILANKQARDADKYGAKAKRLSRKNSDGRYDEKIDKATARSEEARKAAESNAWKYKGYQATNALITSGAKAAGYSVSEARTRRHYITGKNVAIMLLTAGNVASWTTVDGTSYNVRRNVRTDNRRVG